MYRCVNNKICNSWLMRKVVLAEWAKILISVIISPVSTPLQGETSPLLLGHIWKMARHSRVPAISSTHYQHTQQCFFQVGLVLTEHSYAVYLLGMILLGLCNCDCFDEVSILAHFRLLLSNLFSKSFQHTSCWMTFRH